MLAESLFHPIGLFENEKWASLCGTLWIEIVCCPGVSNPAVEGSDLNMG